jgi:hypothetical protein
MDLVPMWVVDKSERILARKGLLMRSCTLFLLTVLSLPTFAQPRAAGQNAVKATAGATPAATDMLQATWVVVVKELGRAKDKPYDTADIYLRDPASGKEVLYMGFSCVSSPAGPTFVKNRLFVYRSVVDSGKVKDGLWVFDRAR